MYITLIHVREILANIHQNARSQSFDKCLLQHHNCVFAIYAYGQDDVICILIV